MIGGEWSGDITSHQQPMAPQEMETNQRWESHWLLTTDGLTTCDSISLYWLKNPSSCGLIIWMCYRDKKRVFSDSLSWFSAGVRLDHKPTKSVVTTVVTLGRSQRPTEEKKSNFFFHTHFIAKNKLVIIIYYTVKTTPVAPFCTLYFMLCFVPRESKLNLRIKSLTTPYIKN